MKVPQLTEEQKKQLANLSEEQKKVIFSKLDTKKPITRSNTPKPWEQ